MATAMLMRPEEEKLFEGQPKVNVQPMQSMLFLGNAVIAAPLPEWIL